MNYIYPDTFGHSFLHDDPKLIYQQCTKEFQQILNIEQFKDMVNHFNQDVKCYYLYSSADIGSETHYIWLDATKQKAVSVYFDQDTRIHRLLIKPYITYPEQDQRLSQMKYSMPIKDDWFVFWGGKNEFINYHYVFESQRYAYDLVIMKNGNSFENSPDHNDNYHAFNKEITAPASGKVIKIVNHIKDNIPGKMNRLRPAGNYIVIQHAENEYSFIAHFKRKSITVKKGDSVVCGDVIGQCGNSGNSSEPHIHFQVMDGPKFSKSKSLCICFKNDSEPVQGDIVTSGT